MTTTGNFCRERAEQAATDAASATLANVRDRYLRAAEAWAEMANRAEKTAARRAVNEDAKAAIDADVD